MIGLGGSAGTTIATAAMRTLPIGVPKVMASTLASGQVRPFVGDKDILMLNTIVDISGINRISRLVLGEAARAMAGLVMLKPASPANSDKPVVAATMFGVTTPCVEHARRILEEAGYEVLVFHATGTGGQAMESLIDDGLVVGVLDITTTELADELVGGILTAGPNRLTAAGRKGIPQVISVGALDMVNFGPPESIPPNFAPRKFYCHNASVTLMRTTIAENAAPRRGNRPKGGRRDGANRDCPSAQRRLRHRPGGTAVRRPRGSVRPVWRPAPNHGNAKLIELDHHINDPEFAEAAARQLIAMLTRKT